MRWLDRMINQRKAVRRVTMAVILVLLCITVWRSTLPEVLTAATAAGGVIVTAIIGLLTLPVKWYFEARKNDSSPD